MSASQENLVTIVQRKSHEWKPRRVIITGATGWLARELAMQIREADIAIKLIGVSRAGKQDALWDEMHCNEDYIRGFRHGSADVIVHCAFCRKSDGPGLAESLEWSREVFGKAISEGAAGIVNISSQSVYSSGAASNTEDVAMSPGYLYAMGKASSEILLRGMVGMADYEGGATSLRMASLMGVSDGKCPNNVLFKFAERALAREQIKVVGGKQRFSFLSVHDAANAIRCVLGKRPDSWRREYNIGPDEQVPILEMARLVAEQASKVSGGARSEIVLEESDIELDAGMVSTLAHEDLAWRIEQAFPDIVRETLAYCAVVNG